MRTFVSNVDASKNNMKRLTKYAFLCCNKKLNWRLFIIWDNNFGQIINTETTSLLEVAHHFFLFFSLVGKSTKALARLILVKTFELENVL